MSEFVKIATLSEIPPGSARAVDAGGTPVALYNVGGTVYATHNACPHRGGSLGEGSVAEAVVTCPWHGFQFEVTTGRCLTNPALSLACIPVKIEGQDILIRV